MKAVATIRQCVDVSILYHVANDKNAYEMWQKMSGLEDVHTDTHRISAAPQPLSSSFINMVSERVVT